MFVAIVSNAICKLKLRNSESSFQSPKSQHVRIIDNLRNKVYRDKSYRFVSIIEYFAISFARVNDYLCIELIIFVYF